MIVTKLPRQLQRLHNDSCSHDINLPGWRQFMAVHCPNFAIVQEEMRHVRFSKLDAIWCNQVHLHEKGNNLHFLPLSKFEVASHQKRNAHKIIQHYQILTGSWREDRSKHVRSNEAWGASSPGLLSGLERPPTRWWLDFRPPDQISQRGDNALGKHPYPLVMTNIAIENGHL
jgi:hypothetical protein